MIIHILKYRDSTGFTIHELAEQEIDLLPTHDCGCSLAGIETHSALVSELREAVAQGGMHAVADFTGDTNIFDAAPDEEIPRLVKSRLVDANEFLSSHAK